MGQNLKTQIGTTLKTQSPEKTKFLTKVFWLGQLDTSTTDEMYLGRLMRSRNVFFIKLPGAPTEHTNLL